MFFIRVTFKFKPLNLHDRVEKFLILPSSNPYEFSTLIFSKWSYGLGRTPEGSIWTRMATNLSIKRTHKSALT